jgi:predicted DNA-binding transcriptional regulator
MSDRTDTLTSLLKPFGLSEEEARIYLVLLERGVMGALEISRKLRMGRTKVYRLLDKLLSKGLVLNQFNETGFSFRAEPPEKLGLLVNLKQAEVEGLARSLPQVQTALLNRMGSGEEGSRVLYYRGRKGLAQVNFNMTKAKDELLSFELSTASAFMKHEEAEVLRQDLVANKIVTKTITNATHLAAFTGVSELVRDWWEIRHIPKERFDIAAEVFVYNDVYCVYRYTDNDVFAVEIYNQDLANMQRQVFAWVWAEAVEMEKVGVEGMVRVRGSK